MKILQLVPSFYPESIGGAELFAEALAKHLTKRNHQVLVAAPAAENRFYPHDGITVRRYAVSETRNLKALLESYRGEGDAAAAAESFGQILDEEKPEIVHQHTFLTNGNFTLVRAARRRGIPVVFSHHSPAVTCSRGTLLRWGHEPCDGLMDQNLCSRCLLDSQGVARPLTAALAFLPHALRRGLRRFFPRGLQKWILSDAWELTRARHSAIRSMMSEVNRIVVFSEWSHRLFRLNGIPAERIYFSPYGLRQPSALRFTQTKGANQREGPLSAAYLGRLSEYKGVKILIQAFQEDPSLPAVLDIYGICINNHEIQCKIQLQNLVREDSRIRFPEAVPAAEILTLLGRYDVLLVPSQALETGPMVVLEAFAAGIPVMGSRLGGIEELIRDGVDGLLVAHDSPNAWRDALRRLGTDRELLERLKAGVRPPRTMEAVTDEMEVLYQEVVGNKKPD